jgi:hypothetical protein
MYRRARYSVAIRSVQGMNSIVKRAKWRGKCMKRIVIVTTEKKNNRPIMKVLRIGVCSLGSLNGV